MDLIRCESRVDFIPVQNLESFWLDKGFHDHEKDAPMGQKKNYCVNYEMLVKIVTQVSSYVCFIHLVLSSSSLIK